MFGSAEHAAAALQAAEESLVLLKNTDGILPLAKGKKLLVTGPNANSMRCLNGGWSYSWQGDKADEHASQYNTILEAFTNKFGADNIIYEAGVTYKQGGNWWEENTPEIEKAVAAAAGADYIVACIGENSYCETPGNLTNLQHSDIAFVDQCRIGILFLQLFGSVAGQEFEPHRFYQIGITIQH